MSNSSHADKALAHVDAVVQTSRHLDSLHGNPSASRADIAKGYDQIRQGLKIAEIHALLAVAEAVEKSTEKPPPVPREERCIRANGMHCPLHDVDHWREGRPGAGVTM